MATPIRAGRASTLLAHKIGRFATFAAALIAGQAAKAQEEVWIGPSNSLWSSGSAWLDGSAPAAGGDPGLTLRFGISGTSVNDFGSPFALNQMVFGASTASNTTVSFTAGSSLTFAGSDPSISLQGIGDVSIGSPIQLNGTGFVIKSTGPANLTLSNAITEGAQPQTLTIDTGASSPNVGVVNLFGSIGVTGGITLKSGNLTVNSFTTQVGGPISVYSGTITVASTTAALNNSIVLHGDLTLRSTASSLSSGTFSGVISSATPGAGLISRSTSSAAAITLSGASTYTGATTLDYSNAPELAVNQGGGLIVGGANGSILQTSEINIRAGSTMRLHASSATDNRVSDTTAIHLRGGNLIYSEGTGSGSSRTEILGAVDGAGFSTINVFPNSTSLRLQLTSLARSERGTFLFRGFNLGNTPANGVGSIFINSAPIDLVGGGGVGPKTSIIPYAIGDVAASGTGTGFVTYSATAGIRPLSTSEYRTTVASAAVDENVHLTTTETLNSARTVNALYLHGGVLSGTGTLTIASGALLQRSGGEISTALAFGSAEANIFATGDLTLKRAVSGTNGLTKSGSGILTLAAPNDFTGPLTINAGAIAFEAMDRLGSDTSAIVINGHGAGLTYTGASSLNFTRSIETRTGLAKIDVTGSGDFNITTPIAGAGGLQLTTANNRTITLPSGSTYAGTTHLGSSRVSIGNDSAFGAGGALNVNGGAIVLSGAWSSAREINIQSGTLDTAGFDAVWSGQLTSMGGSGNLGTLTKRGAGELRIVEQSRFRGSIGIEGGALTLAGDGEIAADVSASNGGELRLDHSASIAGSKLGDSSKVYLNGGKLVVIGNATTAITEKIQLLDQSLDGRSDHTLDLITPGAADLRLVVQDITPGGGLLIRASNLGGKERVVVGDPTGFETGIVRGIYTGANFAGGGDSFVVYDSTSNAGGVVGFRALQTSEYTTGSVLQNPSNGGTTPVDAFVLVDSAVTASGASNTIDNLTLANGGSVSLGAGQSLAITSGSILARAGTSTISGGTLAFGTGRADIYTTGELTIGSTIQGSGGLRKLGPGTLILSAIGHTGGTEIADGTLRPGSGGLFASETLTIQGAGVFDVGAGSASLGAMTGTGTVNVNGGTLTVGGLGTPFTYSGGFSGNGQVIIVSGGNPEVLRTFNGVNSFTGDVVLNSGRLQLGSDNALGSGALIVNGGSLRTSPNVTISQDFVLNADLPLLGSNPIVFGPGASATGTKDFVLRSAAAVSITGNLTMTGRFRTQYGPDDEIALTPGTITVQGIAGGLTTNAGVRIESGGRLDLNDAAAFTGGGEGRLGDTTPVHLGGGRLTYIGNGSVNSTETFGVLSSAGFSTVSLTPSVSASTSLTASSLTRVDRGTFQFFTSNSNLGTGTGPGTGRILFETAPPLVGGGGTGAATSIVPWAVGLSGGVPGLVTYGPNGIRLLTNSEHLTSLASADAASNVRLSTPTTVNLPKTINALSLGPITVSGSAPLSIASGTIVANFTSDTAQISAPLDFGAAEANIFVSGSIFSELNVGGNISGSGGLTLSGPGTLALSGTNSFTGPITINGSSLAFSSLANLGQGTEAITLHGNTTNLEYTGASNLTLPHPIHVGGGIAQITASNSIGSMTVSGVIDGPGALRVGGPGTTVLANTNSYEGPTYIDGSLAITSDAALGLSSTILFTTADAKLRLDGNWTTSRTIDIRGTATIDTNGFEAVIGQPLRNIINVNLVKAGNGALRLTTPQSINPRVTVLGGELRLEQSGNLPTTSLTIKSGGMVSLDNSAIALSGRLPSTTFVSLERGSLQLIGHPVTNVSETLGTLSLRPKSWNVLTLTAPGSASTVLTVSNFVNDNAVILIRGDNLGGPAGSAFTRVILSQPSQFHANLILGAVVDTSSSGQGSSLAIYDSASDGAGTIGVRALKASEYTTGLEIRNPVNEGNTPEEAHFFANGMTSAGGNRNRVGTLRLAGSSTLALGPAQSLTIGAAHLLVDPGANATVSGGTLNLATNRGYAFTLGNLTLGGRMTSPVIHKGGSGNLIFSGDGKIFGFLNLEAGGVTVSTPEALRSVRIDASAGTAINFTQLPAASGGIVGPVAVNLPAGTLTIRAFGGGAVFTGPAGITATGSGGFTDPQAFSGPLVVSARNSPTGVAGTVFSGNGTALMASSVLIEPSATLYFNNQEKVLTRLATIPLEMNAGKIVMSGGPGVETFSSLNARGQVSFEMTNNGTVAFNSFTRTARATLRVYYPDGSANIGKVILPPEVANDLVGLDESLTSRPILPYAWFNVSGNHVPAAFSSANGLRPLSSSELSTTLTAGTNVSITAPGDFTNETNVTINSISTVRSILGSGTISVASGLVLINGGSTISNALSFGAAEAHILSNPGTFTLTGALSGTGGLTKSGDGELVLPVANNISGPLTVNEGAVSFADPVQLGLDTGEIFVHSGAVTWSGTGSFNFPRPIRLLGGPGGIGTTSSNGTLHVTQPVTGTGDLRIVGRVVLDNPPSHNGDIVLDGTLLLGSDASLGTSQRVIFKYGGILALTGPLTTSREFYSSTGGCIDTAGFDATLTGPLVGENLTKAGAGKLTIQDAEDFLGSLVVNGGTVEIQSYLPGAVSSSAGTSLILGGSIGGALEVRGVLDPNPNIQEITATNLRLKANSTLKLQFDSASSYDQVVSRETPSLEGPIALELELSPAWNPLDSGEFVIIRSDSIFAGSYASGSPLAYAGNALAEGELFVTGSQQWKISYQGGVGNNDVVLYAVPEPVTGAALLGGLVLLGLRRRRAST